MQRMTFANNTASFSSLVLFRLTIKCGKLYLLASVCISKLFLPHSKRVYTALYCHFGDTPV